MRFIPIHCTCAKYGKLYFIHDLCNFTTKQPIAGELNPQRKPLEALQYGSVHKYAVLSRQVISENPCTFSIQWWI